MEDTHNNNFAMRNLIFPLLSNPEYHKYYLIFTSIIFISHSVFYFVLCLIFFFESESYSVLYKKIYILLIFLFYIFSLIAILSTILVINLLSKICYDFYFSVCNFLIGKKSNVNLKDKYELIENLQDDQDCPICFSKLSNLGKCILVLDCNHKFCYDCINNWSKIKTTCPICRKKFA